VQVDGLNEKTILPFYAIAAGNPAERDTLGQELLDGTDFYGRLVGNFFRMWVGEPIDELGMMALLDMMPNGFLSRPTHNTQTQVHTIRDILLFLEQKPQVLAQDWQFSAKREAQWYWRREETLTGCLSPTLASHGSTCLSTGTRTRWTRS
jgi:hypothetical protein